MAGNESEWVEVRRRKNIVVGELEDITSFYVTNIPGGIRKSEIWKPCAKLGDLADVYLAGRRDAGGSYFAFVKYRRVNNIIAMEAALNGVTMWGKKIRANVSKHPRKPPSSAGKVAAPYGQKNLTSHSVFRPRDNKSFADVLKGSLQSEEKSPMSLVEDIKYLGGMYVIMKFKSNKAAEMFRANKSIWMKWFMGLEVADVSHGKVCVLSASRRKINDEVMVNVGGVNYSIGVTELDDEWFPFKPFNHNYQSESEIGDDDDSSDGDSSVNMGLEEGEILTEAVAEDEPSMGVDSSFTRGEEELHGNSASHGNDIKASPSHVHVYVNGVYLDDGIHVVPNVSSPIPIASVGPILGPGSRRETSSPDFQLGGSTFKRHRTKKKNPQRIQY
ncbi:unnamed protein product [Lactuca virosa]|uniref:RRM domain-containing protein n=1 Tax=Lactuca virosa TaxID=75947 RepID=A0AAU9LLK2_9ASTR|nr:unnamed protein product [Lactuca virosa]